MRYGQEMDWYAPINNDLSIRANTHNGMDTQTNVFSEKNPLKSDVMRGCVTSVLQSWMPSPRGGEE